MSVGVCVVIPVYNEILSNSEILSLKQCSRILFRYDIFLVYPRGLNVSNYLGHYKGFKLVAFSAKYFDGIIGYNRLMLSPNFYYKFLRYKHLLIYQLDCYVFRDELSYWSDKNFDYIGAPFQVNNQISLTYNSLLHSKSNIGRQLKKIFSKKHPNLDVGNGGLSLRRVFKFWLICVLLKPVINKWLTNEDYFWSLFSPNFIPKFRVASVYEARYFAFEQNCRLNFQEIGRLPFGCHAWEKYEPEFWKDYIPDNINQC